MTTRVILIRHGESVWNNEGRIQGWSDSPLSERGREQAALVARRLAAAGISAVYASPLLRARETADVIADKLGLKVEVDERLKELMLGELEGLTSEEVREQYPHVAHGWREDAWWVPIPGGERFRAFRRRVVEAMNEITERHADETIAVVAHGGSIGVWLAELLGLHPDKRLPFWLENTAVNIVELGGARPIIRLLNDTCHLDCYHNGEG